MTALLVALAAVAVGTSTACVRVRRRHRRALPPVDHDYGRTWR